MTTETSGPPEEQSRGYTARHLMVLEGLEAVRKRPGMYVGSTDARGLMNCLWEIVDNAVDEALAGHCSRIEVVLSGDGAIEVRDDGRGIPVGTESTTGLNGVELVMTRLHAGGKFGGSPYVASGGLHGVGASVVNALSARLDVEVDREGATHAVSFRRGIPGRFGGDTPGDEFEPRPGLRRLRRVAKRVTGTRVRFWPDRQIFLADAEVGAGELRARAQESAFLVPGLAVCVRDERQDQPDEQEFRYSGGISDFCEFLAPDEPVTPTWLLRGAGEFTETVPVLDDSGDMTPQEVQRELAVHVALRWGSGYGTVVRSFVNVVATPKGGTHVNGFERALVKTIGAQLRAAKLVKPGDEGIVKDDVLEGLTAVVTVRLAEPQFEGQTKEVLGTSAASRIVDNVVGTELRRVLTGSKRAEKARARALLEKVSSAARARVAARERRENQRRKNALESSSLPAKLVDCRSDDVDRNELFVVEGDSAMGSSKNARSSEFQALLPIRGKILNVQKASVSDMLKNPECSSIIQVLGAGSGRTFDLPAARYGKIVIMADADADGAHIRCLLLTLVSRYMRPLLEAGHVFAAVPPLHRIETLGSGSKRGTYRYTYSEAEMQRVVADLQRKGARIKEPIQRYKGLGEMDADQLAETTMDPRHRVLRRMRVEDAEAAEEVFELLMGNTVAPRREFIARGAAELDPGRIDT